MYRIPLIRPDIPSLEEILPFLKIPYETGIFSNGGPLVKDLEFIIGKEYNCEAIVVNNATLGIQVVLQTLEEPGTEIAIPSFTFTATAAAVIAAGNKPVFRDIKSLEEPFIPEDSKLTSVRVGSFGLIPKDSAALDINDFAAGFGAGPRKLHGLADIYSFHATKSFGIGEGGVILVGKGTSLSEKIRKAINFGLNSGGESEFVGTNAKMSEFQAAVALAQIKNHTRILEQRRATAKDYEDFITSKAICPSRHLPPNHFAPQVFPIFLPSARHVNQLETVLNNKSIQTRRYYKPLDTMKAYNSYTKSSLTVTKDAGSRAICLPCWSGDQLYVKEIIGAVNDVCNS